LERAFDHGHVRRFTGSVEDDLKMTEFQDILIAAQAAFPGGQSIQ
jgi:hypothetical protein